MGLIIWPGIKTPLPDNAKSDTLPKDASRGMDLQERRQKGILTLAFVLLLFLGIRWGVNRFYGEGLLLPPAGNPPIIVEVRGAIDRPVLLTYSRPPNLGQVLQDAEVSPFQGIKEKEILTDRETGLVLFFDPQGHLRFRREPLSVMALYILGRPVPLNRATAEELDILPGIGPVLAQRIVEFRKTVGAFTSLEQLKEIKGIKEKTWERIKDRLTL